MDVDSIAQVRESITTALKGYVGTTNVSRKVRGEARRIKFWRNSIKSCIDGKQNTDSARKRKSTQEVSLV